MTKLTLGLSVYNQGGGKKIKMRLKKLEYGC
jgi:hypothetical protein